MKINVYPADNTGCGNYRIRWPAQALIDQGADVTIIGAEEPPERQIQAVWWTDGQGRSTVVDVEAPDCDVIVVQRPLTDTLAGAIPLLKAKGVRVVVEIDDDFEAIHPRNTSWADCHPTRSPRRNWRHLRSACAAADWVVVSTPALAARYGRHGRVSVVENCVPARYLDIVRQPHDGIHVGWSGSIDTHPDDLQQCGPAVARVLRATGARFSVVGTGKGVQRALGLDQPVAACGWVDIDDYPTAFAQLDIGIVPLQASAFNEAKSWLKGLEMAALGVPFVASPTSPYCRLHIEGAGRLAGHPKVWGRELRALIGSADARAELAGAGRAVAERWTIEANAERWLEAWSAPVAAMV